MKIGINRDKTLVTITLPIEKAKKSSTGKSLVIASTNGSYKTGIQYEDKDLYVTASFYIRKDKN